LLRASVRSVSEDSTRAMKTRGPDLTSVKPAQWNISLKLKEPLIWITVP